MKRFIKKATIAAGLDAFLVQRSNAGMILGFHHVGEHDGSMLYRRVESISISTFEEILRHLQAIGYSFVSLDEMVNSTDRSQKAVITFDDGFRSIYSHAFPILQQFHAPFTVFLTTAMLDATRLLWLHRLYAAVDRLERKVTYQIMTDCSLKFHADRLLEKTLGDFVRRVNPDQLLLFVDKLASESHLTESDEIFMAERLYLKPMEVIEMMRAGMTIGAHGHHHWSMETLDRSSTESEIAVCKETINSAFGVQPVHYALSYGSLNPHVRSVLERLDFRSLCTIHPGLVQPKANPSALPRLMIGMDTNVHDLAGQITLLHIRHLVTGT